MLQINLKSGGEKKEWDDKKFIGAQNDKSRNGERRKKKAKNDKASQRRSNRNQRTVDDAKPGQQK